LAEIKEAEWAKQTEEEWTQCGYQVRYWPIALESDCVPEADLVKLKGELKNIADLANRVGLQPHYHPFEYRLCSTEGAVLMHVMYGWPVYLR
jgi:hypothetical protein